MLFVTEGDVDPLFATGLFVFAWVVDKAATDALEGGHDGRALDRKDVVFTDINMPGLNGIDLARQVIESDAPTEVILLTMYNDAEFVREGIHRGVMGYLLKDGATGEIVQAIKSAKNKQFHLGEGVRIPREINVAKEPNNEQSRSGVEALSPTERRVVLMIAKDMTSAEIADQLRISIRTVEAHRLNTSRKLGLSGANSLLRFALANRFELEALID